MNVKRLAVYALLVAVVSGGYALYLQSQIRPGMREMTRVYDGQKKIRVRRFLRYGNHGQFSLHYNPDGSLVNGPCADFLLNSEIAVHGECREGKWEGPVRGLGPGDELVLEGSYQDGMKEGEFRYYREGKLNRVQQFSAGRLSGRQEDYYANGQVHCSGTYLDHRREGMYRCFYPDGTPKLEEHFRGGLRNGLHRRWDRSGQLVWEMPFANGRETLHNDTIRVRSVISGDTILLENDQRVRLTGIEEIPGQTPDGKSRPREILKEVLRQGSRFAQVRLEWTDSSPEEGDPQAYVFIDTGRTLDDLKSKSRFDAPADEYYDFFPVRFSHFINATLIRKGAARMHGLTPEDRYYAILHSSEE